MKLIALLASVGVASMAFAQPATKEQMGRFNDKNYDIMHMWTNIGTFKIINGQGRADITFSGSMLVSGYEGDALVIQGKIRKEFSRDGRTVYFGKGRIVFSGKWRAIQWFGEDMKGVWYGNGVIRMRGEFDKDMNTGEFWGRDPKQKNYFPSMGTIDVALPDRMPRGAVLAPKRRVKQG